MTATLDEEGVVQDLLTSAPRLTERWRTDESFDREESSAGNLKGLVRATIDAADEADEAEFRMLFESIERSLQTSSPGARDLIGWRFLEDLQTISTHRACGPEAFEPFLGPKTRQAWSYLDHLWQHAAATYGPALQELPATDGLHPEVRRLVEETVRPGGASVAHIARLERDGELRRPPWRAGYRERFPGDLRADPAVAHRRLDQAINGRLGTVWRATGRRRKRRREAGLFRTLDDYYETIDCLVVVLVLGAARVRISEGELSLDESEVEYGNAALQFDELADELGWSSEDPAGADARGQVRDLVESLRPAAAT